MARAELRLGATRGDVVRIEPHGRRAGELTMSQDDTPDAPVPEPAPRSRRSAWRCGRSRGPVTRMKRRTLAMLAGGLAVLVLGATMWSLRPAQRRSANEPAEQLYNVDRVSRSEGLSRLPADYSKLPPTLPPQVPELGPPLPGDLGPAIVRSQQPAVASYSPPSQETAAAERDALRKEAEAAAGSSVFFRSGGQRAAAESPQVAAAHAGIRLRGLRPAGRRAGLDGGPADRPDRRRRTAKIRKRRS